MNPRDKARWAAFRRPRCLRARLRCLAAAVTGLGLLSPLNGDELDLPVGAVDPAFGDPATGSDLIAPLELVFAATRPAFSYHYAQIDGVLAEPGQSQDSTVQTAAVALHWSPGDRFAFRYRTAWTWYSSEAFEDNLSHDAGVRAEFVSTSWRTSLSHRYFRASAPLIETGRQTSQDRHSTAVQATRSLGPRSTLELGLVQNLRFAEEFTGFREWATQDWFHYRISNAFTGSAGLTYGYMDIEDGAVMTYEQFRGRVRWQPAQNVVIDFRGGLETRQVSGSADTSSSTPVFGGTLTYQFLPTTRFIFSADQRVAPSLLLNQLSRSTLWRIGFEQRLLERFQLSLVWLRRSLEYEVADDSTIAVREDRGQTLRARLATHIRSRGELGLTFHRTRNRSTVPGFAFTGRQFGIDLSVSY